MEGSLPAATQAIIDNPPAGATVKGHSAGYDRNELEAARDQLNAQNEYLLAGTNTWTHIGLGNTGVGLEVGIAPKPGVDKGTLDLAAITNTYEGVAKVKVVITISDGIDTSDIKIPGPG